MAPCVVCEEEITHPICAGCLEREVATWLQERLPGVPEALLQLEDVTDEIHVAGKTRCIKCGSGMGVCSHCYFAHLEAWVAGRHASLLSEFDCLFGFDVRERPALPVRPRLGATI